MCKTLQTVFLTITSRKLIDVRNVVSRNLTELACHTPVRDQRVQFNVMVLTFSSLSISIVCLRLLFKQFFSVKQRLQQEDWIILAAMPIGIATVLLTVFGLTAHGMGRDIWGLQPSDAMSFGTSFYLVQMLYIVLITLIKLSLNFFYLNIFPGTVIRRLLWASVIFHVAFSLAFVIGIMFQCRPISYQWEQYNFMDGPPAQGDCFNINAGAWSNGAISVASDVWLFGMPLSQVRKLRLHWKKKIGVALMFLTGAM